MRVAFFSNFYPPSGIGGYEQLCHEVATELARRQHDVSVVTSRGSTPRGEMAVEELEGVHVYRSLHLEAPAGVLSTAGRLCVRERLDRANLAQLESFLGEARPEAALIWGMWNVPRSVPAEVERLLGDRVAYYLCDYWPTLPNAAYQQFACPANHRVAQLPKRILAWPVHKYLARNLDEPLRLQNAVCVSEAVRHTLVCRGIRSARWPVIRNGIRLDDFPYRGTSRASCTPDSAPNSMKLLYCGRLTAAKGVHTAIRALTLVAEPERVTLDIIGRGEPAYEKELKALVNTCALGDQVAFQPDIPRAAVPETLAKYDAFIFPSVWEALPRAPMEALAVGVPVIGTATGGTGELLVDGVTALTFPTGDERMLATQINRLRQDPTLSKKLAQRGRQWVEERFSFDRMVDGLEGVLTELAQHERA